MGFFAALPMEAGIEPGAEKADAATAKPRLDARWLDTGKFSYTFVAPVARAQDLTALTNTIVSWARASRKG